MNKKRLIVITIGIILFIIILKVWVTVASYNHKYQPHAISIYNVLSKYIESNNGSFPRSEEDLITQNYLRKTRHDDKAYYSYKLDPNSNNWHKVYFFNEFTIKYGAKLSDLEIRDGSLCKKGTKTKIYLLTGPRKYILPSFYEGLSKHLYKEMLKHHRNVNNT